jgi:hypothetical protein
MAKGMIKWLSNPREPINDNLTGCLQRGVVVGYERMIKWLISNTNNVVLEIIPGKHNCGCSLDSRNLASKSNMSQST